MGRVLQALIAVAALAAIVGVAHAAPSGKPVPTETITVPPGQSPSIK
jgi:hypothetical protein